VIQVFRNALLLAVWVFLLKKPKQSKQALKESSLRSLIRSF
jgi:hypothetical protein